MTQEQYHYLPFPFFTVNLPHLHNNCDCRSDSFYFHLGEAGCLNYRALLPRCWGNRPATIARELFEKAMGVELIRNNHTELRSAFWVGTACYVLAVYYDEKLAEQKCTFCNASKIRYACWITEDSQQFCSVTCFQKERERWLLNQQMADERLANLRSLSRLLSQTKKEMSHRKPSALRLLQKGFEQVATSLSSCQQ